MVSVENISPETPLRGNTVIRDHHNYERFVTVAEVASLMRVSKMTVYRLVHSGELPAIRVGRSFRVHARAVHELLGSSFVDAG